MPNEYLVKIIDKKDFSRETVNNFIKTCCDINEIYNNWTALMFAVYNTNRGCSLEIVQILINAGADVNVQATDVWTALMLAAKHSKNGSSLETVQALINAGADLNIQDTDGWTALMLAARYSTSGSSLETVQALINAGADLNIQDTDGCTALMLAAKHSTDTSSIETVQALNNAIAKFNEKALEEKNQIIEKIQYQIQPGTNFQKLYQEEFGNVSKYNLFASTF